MAKKDKEETSLATTEAPGALTVIDYGDDAGKGYEGQSTRDVTIPWMKLAQAMSPEVTKELIPGLKPGMWFNSVTQTVYPRDQGFLFVPAFTRSVYAKWTPRKGEGSGGNSKFYGLEEPDSPVVMKAIQEGTFGDYRTRIKQIDKETGREEEIVVSLVDTRYVWGVLCSEDGFAEGMVGISFSRTKVRAFKAWNSRMANFTIRHPTKGLQKPPLYGHLARIASITDQNDKKQEYWIPKISSYDPRGLMESLLPLTDERFLLGRQCSELMKAGELKVNFEAEGDAAGGEEEGDAPKTSGAFM